MTRPMTRVHVGNAATINLGDGSTTIKLNGLLELIVLHGVTILGMQEGGDRAPLLARLLEILRHPIRVARRLRGRHVERRTIRKALRRFGCRVYRPSWIPGGGSVPTAYDARKWKRLRARTVVAVARAWVGSVGAGPTWSKPKAITVVVLRDRRTGEVVEHLNTHMIPSVQRDNLPEKEERARRRHIRKHIGRLARMVRRAVKAGRSPLVTMDANLTARSPLLDPLSEVGLVGWTLQGTKGPRGIDHVLTVLGAAVWGGPPRVVRLAGFDHRAVVRPLYAAAGGAR